MKSLQNDLETKTRQIKDNSSAADKTSFKHIISVYQLFLCMCLTASMVVGTK